jgi:hypothetical protein
MNDLRPPPRTPADLLIEVSDWLAANPPGHILRVEAERRRVLAVTRTLVSTIAKQNGALRRKPRAIK